VEVDLLFQPISHRWARNLEAYRHAMEPDRFSRYFQENASAATARLASATARVP
jgi:hypothetical protein